MNSASVAVAGAGLAGVPETGFADDPILPRFAPNESKPGRALSRPRLSDSRRRRHARVEASLDEAFLLDCDAGSGKMHGSR